MKNELFPSSVLEKPWCSWKILWKRTTQRFKLSLKKMFFDGFLSEKAEIHLNFWNWKSRQIDWRKTYWFVKEKTRETDARPICIKSSKWTKAGIMWRQKRVFRFFNVLIFYSQVQLKKINTNIGIWQSKSMRLLHKVSLFVPFFQTQFFAMVTYSLGT